MSIQVTCPGCQQRYSAPESAAGKTTRCRACGASLSIPRPGPSESPSNLYDLVEEATAGPRIEQPAEPRPRTVHASDERRSSAPLGPRPAWTTEAERKRWGRRAGLGAGLIGAAVLALMLGYREWRLSSLAKPTPTRVSLADLMVRGPGDNIYLDLTEARLLLDRGVYEYEERPGVSEHCTYAWIPAVPTAAGVQPDRVRVLIGTKECQNATVLEAFAQQAVIRGIVVNSTDNLNREQRELLQDGLPNLDLASCILFRANQHPTSGLIHALLIGGGLLAAGLGLALFVPPHIALWRQYQWRRQNRAGSG